MTESIQLTEPKQEESASVWYVFPEKIRSYEKLSIPYKMDMMDEEVNLFFSQVVPETIETTIRNMKRVKAVSRNLDTNNRERGEWLVWYCELHGKDRDNNPVNTIVSDLPQGFTYTVIESGIRRDSQGHILPSVETNPPLELVYTQKYTPEKVEELVSSSVLTSADDINYTIESGGESLSVGSYIEFKELSFEELRLRNQIGRTAFPTDILFSKLTGEQRLQQEGKKQ